MKKFKIGIIALLVLTLTGCGNKSYIVDEDKKPVTYEATGQTLQKDILCKPEDSELSALYEKYSDQLNVSYDELPSCKTFKINSNKSSGIWEGIFVKPLAFIILKLGYLLNNFGLSVILIGLAIRLILMPVSLKTQRQSNNMKKAQPELSRIEKKYANKDDKDSMMAKSQEMMAIYKKYHISPMGSCLLAFIQLPLFFAFLQAINRTPAIFEDKFLGMTLGTTPMVGLFQNHQYLYILIIVLVIGTTYFSFRNAMKTSNSGNPDMDKQMGFMFKFMIIMISVASLYLSTAIALYWIATNAFVVLQNYIFKKLDEKSDKKEIVIKPKKEKKEKKK